ncbi:MAG: type VI secretion system baseplate subunit TssK [Gemmataceae bacterium]|nr:type VI secretion system baseplate subunit TssK [Gemmataceae bacterium]
MAARPVHWHEGMFLRPHHFQAAQRHLAHETARGDKWDLHHNWGLRKLDLDKDALANNRFLVRSLQARLRDGTLVSLPEDGDVPALDLKPALERSPSLTVNLALPTLHLGRANVGQNRADGARFVLDAQELEDETTGVNPQLLQVRLLNVQLLLSTQDAAGYEVLPIARIEKAARADAAPQLDESYIPPVLACDAWQPLQAGLLQAAHDRIGKKLDLLAEQVGSRRIDFDSTAQGERMLFEQLRILNEAHARLGAVVFTEGVHPHLAYVELCGLVGRLAVFGEARRTPSLPAYDHDDLGGCFHAAKNHLDALLDAFVEPAYKERPFVGAGLRMQVALESLWLEPGWDLFIGVDSPLPPEECVRLLTKPGLLDMKVGASDRVDNIFRMGQAGLRFAYAPQPPAALPQRGGLVFFRIDKASSPTEWLNVQKALSLAIRLNENRVAGGIQDQRRLTIKTGEGTTTLQFTLFVILA